MCIYSSHIYVHTQVHLPSTGEEAHAPVAQANGIDVNMVYKNIYIHT